MRVLFAAGDAGGARALIPVVNLARRQCAETMVLRHGHMAAEGAPAWHWIESNPGNPDVVLNEARPDVVIFASSVKDAVPLAAARAAQRRQIPTIHVLDSWTMYRQRMCTDNEHVFVPTIYTVIDDLAAAGAIAEGIPKSILRVTGQPALANTASMAVGRPGLTGGRLSLLFVSEPAAADHGESPQSPQYRGYTEASVLTLLCAALQPLTELVFISVLPHPRENPRDIENVWRAQLGKLEGEVLRQHALGDGLASFDGVIGMASILLYQAWLVGRPVLSIQPNLRVDALRQIAQRQGAILLDNPADAAENIRAWVSHLSPGQPCTPRPELALHVCSAECILALTREVTAAQRPS